MSGHDSAEVRAAMDYVTTARLRRDEEFRQRQEERELQK